MNAAECSGILGLRFANFRRQDPLHWRGAIKLKPVALLIHLTPIVCRLLSGTVSTVY
jgi:hypothetical protein